jgi:hypothetical protein
VRAAILESLQSLVLFPHPFHEPPAGVPNLALDFLSRPTTMASRQHSGTQALHKTGKTRAATATALLRGRGADMAGWFMRRLQCLPCEAFTLFFAEIATAAGSVGTPTNHRRNNVLRTRQRAPALLHGGATD